MTEALKSIKKTKKPSVALLLCFLAAFLIWAFGYFSKVYIVKLEYSIECNDLPLEKTEYSLSDSMVVLVFKTSGFNYLKRKYSTPNRVIHFPVNQLIESKKKNRYNYIFSKKELEVYLKNIDFYANEFVEIEAPEVLTLYLK